jgi:transcriptional regulator with XRE-family HTH domain
MSKTKKHTSNILDNILNQTTEEESGIVEYRMLLAVKIDNALKTKGWKKKDLAEATGKSRSTITQWLSGTHNFTSDTLWELGKILNVNLLNIEDAKTKEQVNVYRINISSGLKQEEGYNHDNWLSIQHGLKNVKSTGKLRKLKNTNYELTA